MAIYKFPVRIAVEPFTAAEIEIDTDRLSAFDRTYQAALRLTHREGTVIALPMRASPEAAGQLIQNGGFPAGEAITSLEVQAWFGKV